MINNCFFLPIYEHNIYRIKLFHMNISSYANETVDEVGNQRKRINNVATFVIMHSLLKKLACLIALNFLLHTK